MGGDKRKTGSGFDQPCCVKAVQPREFRVGMGEMARQRADIAIGGDEFRQSGQFAGLDRLPLHLRFGIQQRGDGLLAFLRFQRTGAIDQRAAGLEQAHTFLQQPLLQRVERAEIGFVLQPGDVGVAADGAGRHAGRVEKDRIEWTAVPFGRIGRHASGFEREPREIVPQAREPPGGTIDRGDMRARLRELRGLAARCRAQIGDGFSGDVAEQPRGNRGGSVLHPPRALAKARQHGDRPMQQRAHGAGRQRFAVKARGPACGFGFHREIERRLVADGARHRARVVFAISLDPARHQPWRQIDHAILDLFDQRQAFARATAQHRVDESGILRRASVGLHEAYRQIDGGVIGHVHPQDLRSADQQRALCARRVGRNAAIEQTREEMAERAETAEHGGDEAAHQRAVAIRQRLENGMRGRAFKLIVQRAPFVENTVDDVGGYAARGEAGHLCRRNESRRLHGILYNQSRERRACRNEDAGMTCEYAKCKNRDAV